MNVRSIIYGLLLFSSCHVVSAETQQGKYSFTLLKGAEVERVADFVAQSVREQFSGYPYFYAGDSAEAQEYVQWLISLQNIIVAVAYHDDEPVGFVTGIPCVDFDAGAFKQAKDVFTSHGLDYRNFYYVSEVIILPEHRNKKLAETLYYMVEAHAQELGYEHICYAKESDEEHPRKPAGYKGLGRAFREEGGYQRTDMIVLGLWDTFMPDGSVKIHEHALRYWIKSLSKKQTAQ